MKILKKNIPTCALCGEEVTKNGRYYKGKEHIINDVLTQNGEFCVCENHIIDSDLYYQSGRFEKLEIIEKFQIESFENDIVVTNFGNIQLDSNEKMNVIFWGEEADVFKRNSYALVGASKRAKCCILNSLAHKVNGLDFQIEPLKGFAFNTYEANILETYNLTLTHHELSQFMSDITGEEVELHKVGIIVNNVIHEMPLEALDNVFELWKLCNSMLKYKIKFENFLFGLKNFIEEIK